MVRAAMAGMNYPLYQEIRVHGEHNFDIEEYDIASSLSESKSIEREAINDLNAKSLDGYKTTSIMISGKTVPGEKSSAEVVMDKLPDERELIEDEDHPVPSDTPVSPGRMLPSHSFSRNANNGRGVKKGESDKNRAEHSLHNQTCQQGASRRRGRIIKKQSLQQAPDTAKLSSVAQTQRTGPGACVPGPPDKPPPSSLPGGAGWQGGAAHTGDRAAASGREQLCIRQALAQHKKDAAARTGEDARRQQNALKEQLAAMNRRVTAAPGS